ncbi:sensor histidine kinase [Bacteroidota bacterium]
MKNRKLQLGLITLTFVSLLALIIIQVSWIVKAANIQEKQFSHSVNLAMKEIVEKIADDQSICQEVANCIGKGGTVSCYKNMYNNIEWTKVDSIVKCALDYYNINIDYEFDIVDTRKDSDYNVCKKTYFSDNLESVLLRNAIELKIRFPKKSEFIAAQISIMFVTSILLIVLISFSFIVIIKYYKREKALYLSTRDFINNITHEFKTPITNIALANSMISKNEKIISDEKLNKYSKIIAVEHKKLKNRVEGLLDVARIENGSDSYCETINICDLIKCTVDSYSVQIQELKGDIKYERITEICTVHANKEEFQTAISNLIDNAIKYCEKEPLINIKTYNKGNNIFIEVEDNGIGISQDHIKQIFEKYYRVPTGDVQNVRGFGIGLSTVKAIIVSVNGEINVQSVPGKGSRFIIKLPYCSES